ncbi:MAG: condensation domain-containing protein, partial [Blastocatellia bacterium]
MNIEAFRRAVGDVVARHEALRTSFPRLSARPAQVISEELETQIPVIDLSALAHTLREAEARRIATYDAAQGFDISRAPLFRFSFIKLSPREHLFVVVIHHIISDGWSTGVLVRELRALYESRVNNTRAELPDLTVQYGDYAVWQRNRLRGERLERELEYWKLELEGAPAAIELPADRRHPAVASHKGMTLTFKLDAGLRVDLNRLARSRNATPFMVLLAGFYALLARYSGQLDIVIGTPVANRDRIDVEPLIGFFVNTLPIRLRGEQRDTFEALLERVKRTALGAFAHQEAPFEKIMEALRPARVMSGHPLFQVLFAFQNAPMPALRFSELDVVVDPIDSGTAKFDLSLMISAIEDQFETVFEYSTDLFDRATISRFAAHFERLLIGAVIDPRRPFVDLPLVTPSEISLILEDEPVRTYTGPVHSLFEAQAQVSPDRIALRSVGDYIS